MALPTINSLSECADFSRTVLPYVSELSTLPWRLIQSGWALNELRSIYLTTNPFISGLAMSLFLAPVFLVVSEVNRNYSQVDRCWSILPTLYIAHFAGYAHLAGLPTERLDYLLACSLAWTVSRSICPS
jgi:steroid 5-alpha reductase family enzyme